MIEVLGSCHKVTSSQLKKYIVFLVRVLVFMKLFFKIVVPLYFNNH